MVEKHKAKPRKPGREIGKIETDAGSQEMTIFEKGPAMTPEQIEEIKKENEQAEQEIAQMKKEQAEKDKIELEKAAAELEKMFNEYAQNMEYEIDTEKTEAYDEKKESEMSAEELN